MKSKQAFFTALDGRVKFIAGEYNITADPVWLAAFAAGSIKNIKNKEVLDVGIGTGGAALCLLSHCPDLKITGIDISEAMLAECAQNASLNGRTVEMIHADILRWRTSRTFDIVMTNPPYFIGTPRKGNMHHNVNLYDWTRACLRRVRPRGYFYCIVDAATLSKVVAALYDGRAGDVNILPLFGNKNTAERVLISARAGTRGGAKVCAGMSMNDECVLRGFKILNLRFEI